ncbi:hypothetical protein HDU76_001484 [Blyttiomyces sp. JEL0837]|nr:hypothetical protein HDU76_001484 [Blyttiomyces sp. JEL0837]
MSVVAQKRAKAFAHLDEAQLGWFHLRAVLVSGVGFFTDSYDIFVISQCLPMIYQLYYPQYLSGSYPSQFHNASAGASDTTPYTLNDNLVSYTGAKAPWYNTHIDAFLKAATNWGNFIGQLLFGYLGDKLGRKKMYGVELIIMIVCTIGSAMTGSMVRGWDIITVLIIWRFFLGIGIGGDYPMSAIITSEFANVRYRGMMLAAVFAMQGIGQLVGGLVFVATLLWIKPFLYTDYTYLDYVWRIALGVGVIPGVMALYFRLTIPETPRYTVDVIGDTDKAERDVEKVLTMNAVRDVTSGWGQEETSTAKVAVKKDSFLAHFGQWKNLKVILGTAYCWFVLDIAWYGLSLNNSVVLGLINFNGPSKTTFCPALNGPCQSGKSFTPPTPVWEYFYQRAIGNIIIVAAGSAPGYWVTVALVEFMGRKPIQILGFSVITIILMVLAAKYDDIKSNETTFMTLYTIAQFFFNFGPNATTFIVPGEVFPTRWRSTGHGISAACGKVGAILGIQAVGPYFTGNTTTVLWTFAAAMATGVPATIWLVPETKGKTLEELSMEDDVIVEEAHVEYINNKA